MIDNAIASVLDQSYLNWELIVVDDGSTDNTKEIVSEVVKKDKRVKYFFQENKERSAARNKGIKIASGEWICFLDSDDLYHTSHLEKFKKLINKNNKQPALYFCGLGKNIFDNENYHYNNTHKNNIEFVLLNTVGTPRACSTKKILLEYKFNETLFIGEDMELWARILIDYELYFHHNKTFIQLEHENRSINLASSNECLKTLKYILRNNKEVIRKIIKNEVLSNEYFNISKHYLKKNKEISALNYLLKSIFINLRNRKNRHKLLLILSIFRLYKSQVLNQYRKC